MSVLVQHWDNGMHMTDVKFTGTASKGSGTLFHMMWSCPMIVTLWPEVKKHINLVLGASLDLIGAFIAEPDHSHRLLSHLG